MANLLPSFIYNEINWPHLTKITDWGIFFPKVLKYVSTCAVGNKSVLTGEQAAMVSQLEVMSSTDLPRLMLAV